jgi:hypothetical protein
MRSKAGGASLAAIGQSLFGSFSSEKEPLPF